MMILRKSHNFAPWDAGGMAAHLEAMESKGWRFRGTDWLGRWEYEPCTPKDVRYAVAYAPSRSVWRLTPTEPERDLEDLCFDAGWRKIAALSMFHIYRNPDPDATPLESDELPRLDTLHRALSGPMIRSALLRTGFAVALLWMLISALRNDLPRTLASPILPAGPLFCLWLAASELIPLGMYHAWRNAARTAAEAGLPCPEVKHWQRLSRLSRMLLPLLLVLLLTAGDLPLLAGYWSAMLAFYGLRWWLENRMEDLEKAERLYRISIAAVFILLFAFNRIHSAAIPTVEHIPLSARDLVDTTGMDLGQFDLNGTDSLLASYHDYWQPDNSGRFDLRYEVFDLRLPVLEEACRDRYLADFEAIATRTKTAIEPADPAPWGAEEAHRAENCWLLFYKSRIVYLSTSFDLTPQQITAAAAKLVP